MCSCELKNAHVQWSLSVAWIVPYETKPVFRRGIRRKPRYKACEEKRALLADVLKYWIISSILCQIVIPVHVNCTSMIWYVKRQAGYISHLDLIRTKNLCLFFFFCLMHHFSNYFSCVPFPDELFHSFPANFSMKSACPSIIPLVHYLSPEHSPRTSLAVVLVAWRLFQSQREQLSCLTWVPDAIWEDLGYQLPIRADNKIRGRPTSLGLE